MDGPGEKPIWAWKKDEGLSGIVASLYQVHFLAFVFYLNYLTWNKKMNIDFLRQIRSDRSWAKLRIFLNMPLLVPTFSTIKI